MQQEFEQRYGYQSQGERIHRTRPPLHLHPWWRKQIFGAEESWTDMASLLRVLEGELREGEQVVWSARPEPEQLYRTLNAGCSSLGLLIGLSIFYLCLALAILAIIKVAGGLSVWLLVIVGTVATLLAIVAAFLSVRSGSKTLPQVLYAITDQRIIILSLKRATRVVESYSGRRTTIETCKRGERTIRSYTSDNNITSVEQADGTGDLHFAERVMQSGETLTSSGGKMVGISNLRMVEQLIREMFGLEAKEKVLTIVYASIQA